MDALAPEPRGSARFAMIRNLGLLGVGQVLTKGIAFIALATLARRLSRAEYGAVEYALGLSSFAWLIIDGGLGAVGVRRLSQHVASAGELAAQIPVAQLILALGVAPSMFLLAAFSAHDRLALTLVGAMSLSVLLLPFKQDWLFQARGQMSHVVVSQVIRTGVFMLIVVFAVWGDANTQLVGIAEIISVASTTGYLLLMQHLLVTPARLSFSRDALIGLAREGLPIGAGAICWAATQFVPLFVLTPLAGMEQTAYFGAAHRLGVSLVTFSWIYHFNLFPVIARRIHSGGAHDDSLLRLSIRITGWGGIGIALALSLAAPRMLPLLFGPAFSRASIPFIILVWTFPLTLLSGHARWLLVAAEHAGDMLKSQVLGVVAALVASGVFIPWLGAKGAAAAMTLACVAVWLSSQLLADRRGRHVPFKPCVAPMLAAAVVLTAARLTALANPWLEAAVGSIAFAALGLIFDSSLREDLLWLAGRQRNVPAMT